MITNTTERARLLIGQKRYKEAEKELQKTLASDPNNPDIFSLLSICKSEEGEYDEAEKLIQNAISLNPANPHLIYIYANILFQKGKYTEAEKTIREAITLNPHDADFFGLLAAIHLHEKEWTKSLEAADKGLEISPDNLSCLNIRSTALLKLNKKEDSFKTIHDALNHDPDSPVTHANLGWGLLEKGDHKKALEHFRKALQSDPQSEFAKEGMVEALKARYLFYRLFLRYVFWMSKMKGRAQWGILIGLYIGFRIMEKIADSSPALKPFVMPFIVLYVLFAISSWITQPLANLLLRLNLYGRYALSKKEIITSNLVGLALLTGIAGFITYLFTQLEVFLMTGIFGLTMMIPLSSTLNPENRKKRIILIAYTSTLGLIGIGSLLLIATGNPAFNTLGMIYLAGLFLYQFIANAMIIQ